MENQTTKNRIRVKTLAVAAFLFLIPPSWAAVPLVSEDPSLYANPGSDRWKVLIGGFIETDTINDSTRSFNEVIGNAPVQRPDSLSGELGREQFSIRNSRLGFDIHAPDQDGWRSRAYFEFDLLGYDPAPTSNSEAGFFNNPTFRLRHGFLEASHNGWSFLAGQTWALFGWQPYYFMPTVEVAPIPGMLYSRTAQLRATKMMDLADQQHLQVALGIMRPPQRDASVPGLEAGMRWSYNGWSGGFVGGSAPPQQTQPLSVGVTGTVREFSLPENAFSPTSATTNYTGRAVAVDALIPVIPSRDGKDVSNTLTVGGEFSTGTGYGDQYANWTGNLANPLNSLSTAPNKYADLDAGIGGYGSDGNFSLIDLRVLNAYGQYHFAASSRTWISGGYGWLYSDNVNSMTASASSLSTILYNKEQIAFANVMKDMTDHIRLGLEYAEVRTSYADGTLANDNRYQFSAFFFF